MANDPSLLTFLRLITPTREDAAPLAKPHSEARSFIPQPRSSATYRPLLRKFGRWDDTQDFKPRPWMRIQHLTNVSTEYQSHTNTVPPAKKRHHERKRRKSDCLLHKHSRLNEVVVNKDPAARVKPMISWRSFIRLPEMPRMVSLIRLG